MQAKSRASDKHAHIRLNRILIHELQINLETDLIFLLNSFRLHVKDKRGACKKSCYQNNVLCFIFVSLNIEVHIAASNKTITSNNVKVH